MGEYADMALVEVIDEWGEDPEPEVDEPLWFRIYMKRNKHEGSGTDSKG